MNETLAKILKFLSKNMGYLLINLAVLLILFSFFVNSSINNIDLLKNELQETTDKSIKEEINEELGKVQNDYNSEITQNQQFNKFFEDIKSKKNYIYLSIFGSLILFSLGFIFVYLSIFNLLIASYKVSVHLTIHNFLAAFYFNLIPRMINSAFSALPIRELPREFLDNIKNIILNWIQIPLFTTIKLSIILGVTFLIISMILYFVKKKALKVKDKAK